jgi:hypothetical protein
MLERPVAEPDFATPERGTHDMTRRLAIVLVAACFALACGGSQEDKMERGLTVDQETAAPGAASEYDMTEAERQAKLDAEDQKKEIEEFDEAAGQ